MLRGKLLEVRIILQRLLLLRRRKMTVLFQPLAGWPTVILTVASFRSAPVILPLALPWYPTLLRGRVGRRLAS